MALYQAPIYCGDQGSQTTGFNNANGTGILDITTADANGPIRVDSFSVSNDDTSAGVLYVYLHNGTAAFKLAAIAIPANSLVNTGATSPLDVLRSTNMKPFVVYDSAGNPHFEIKTGSKLQASLVAAPTSGKIFNVRVHWGKYGPT